MTEPVTETDVIIIGGGIAGAGCAFTLAEDRRVVLLERETQYGYHSTGRSAASFTENYGTPTIRKLAIASRDFLETPPSGFSEAPLVSKRGMLTIARSDQKNRLDEEFENGSRLVGNLRRVSREEALSLCSVLRPDYVDSAFLEPDSRELDVDALHNGFLRGARARGAQLHSNCEVMGLQFSLGRWTVHTKTGMFTAPVVVNAAGAWADEVAGLAGIAPLGLQPKKRTAFNISAPEGADMSGWPLINDVDEEFYFKRDAGQIFVSPADATPSQPGDVWADDMDVAIGAERLEAATTIEVQRILHSWAGLRTFAPDGDPVLGFDPANEGFFWLAGQGGYGIKTAVAMSACCAGLIGHNKLPDNITALGLEVANLAPVRLRKPVLSRMEQIDDN